MAHWDYVVLWDRVIYITSWSIDLMRSYNNLQLLYLYNHSAYDHTKLGKLVTCHEGLPPIMLLHPLVTWSCKILWQTKIIILCHKIRQDGALPLLSFTHKVKWPYNHVILWDRITNFLVYIVSPRPQCLWPQSVAGWWLTLIDFYPQSQMTI